MTIITDEAVKLALAARTAALMDPIASDQALTRAMLEAVEPAIREAVLADHASVTQNQERAP